jgi:hypothetical protein
MLARQKERTRDGVTVVLHTSTAYVMSGHGGEEGSRLGCGQYWPQGRISDVRVDRNTTGRGHRLIRLPASTSLPDYREDERVE